MSVVVWEWWSSEVEDWLPHNAGVSRTLERAHHKNLTRVVLADADPTLHSHHVNLLTLTQTYDSPDGVTIQCAIRRRIYEAGSPAARGVCWEWAPDGEYQPLPMEFQISIEHAWQNGGDTVNLAGWWVSLSARTAGRGGVRGAVRRSPAPPHPRPEAQDTREARPRIPQQHTGSSVHSIQSTQSARSVQSARSTQSAHSTQSTRSAHSTLSARSTQSAQSASAQSAHTMQSSRSMISGSTQTITRNGARSVSPRDRKPNLARQILHNLNIFSNNNKPPPREWERDRNTQKREIEEKERDSDGGNRRHSVDTVSTYLSHESKDSLQASVGELVNTSTGSDDVFITDTGSEERNEVGLPPLVLSPALSPQWGALCPECVLPLAPRSAQLEAVSDVVQLPCHHLLHLHCLNTNREGDNGESIIECLVCGAQYADSASPPRPLPRPRAAPAQPPGAMAWSTRPTPLSAFPHHHTIVVTYTFQSGRQSANHPCPGEPYYAVGFPKYSVLPDTPLGRQVLSALRLAWSMGVLFSVSISRRTGRQHVVWWSVAPPPRAPEDYDPLHTSHAMKALTAARDRLTALCRSAH